MLKQVIILETVEPGDRSFRKVGRHDQFGECAATGSVWRVWSHGIILESLEPRDHFGSVEARLIGKVKAEDHFGKC